MLGATSPTSAFCVNHASSFSYHPQPDARPAGVSNRTEGGLLRLTRSLWAFGEPQKSIRLIAICFSLQILFAGGADGYNNSNGSAMSLKKKRLAALYFANRLIQRDFPLRAYVAPNVGDPFMGAHSFSSVNALYLHGVRHPNLLTGACYQECHAFVRYAPPYQRMDHCGAPPDCGEPNAGVAGPRQASPANPSGHMRRCETGSFFLTPLFIILAARVRRGFRR